MQSIKIKKRIPNLILGLTFGLVGIYLGQSVWAYVFFFLCWITSVFGDKIVNVFKLKAESGKYNLKGFGAKMKVIDKNGNIISKSK